MHPSSYPNGLFHVPLCVFLPHTWCVPSPLWQGWGHSRALGGSCPAPSGSPFIELWVGVQRAATRKENISQWKLNPDGSNDVYFWELLKMVKALAWGSLYVWRKIHDSFSANFSRVLNTSHTEIPFLLFCIELFSWGPCHEFLFYLWVLTCCALQGNINWEKNLYLTSVSAEFNEVWLQGKAG